jgi:hypothetical protein
MTYETAALQTADVQENLHRDYSYDQIKSLVSQAASIAEQEGMTLIQDALGLLRQFITTCQK